MASSPACCCSTRRAVIRALVSFQWLSPNLKSQNSLQSSLLKDSRLILSVSNPQVLSRWRFPFYRRLSYSSITEESAVPQFTDYRSTLQEDEYHRLADTTLHDLLEKLEEYGDSLEMDGFDIDYGNQVLTLKLGSLGTYVINKQAPNRQIWMSSPVSGPSRFDWDQATESWIYRRTQGSLLKVLETELEKLCGQPIKLA